MATPQNPPPPDPGPPAVRSARAPRRSRVRRARRRIREGFYGRAEFQALLVHRLLARLSEGEGNPPTRDQQTA